MTTTPTACPLCAGPSLPHHPAGALAWRHEQWCELLHDEDATAAADSERLLDRAVIIRPATDTEQVLLDWIGYSWPATETPTTMVRAFTHGVRLRTWPTARPPAPTPGGTP